MVDTVYVTKLLAFFDVLLTVHISISNLTNLMHKILFYNKFIISPYMFRALCAHHQGSKLYYTTSGIIKPVGGVRCAG